MAERAERAERAKNSAKDTSPEPDSAWRVLIADDDRLTRMMLRRVLEQEGCEVIEADNGEVCLEQFAIHQPNLVLLDALMPVLNGFECCAKLTQQFPLAPILMITGLEDQSSVNQAFDAGATDYLTKPIHWAVLRRRVRLILEKAQLQQELQAANAQLQRLVITDPLTQLANRRYFDQELENEWRRAIRDGSELSLAMCDIDSFKPYNDHYGHLEGDRCLQRVAQVFHQSIHRAGDTAARYGGEEFALILPQTPLQGALYVAERIRRGILDLAIPHHAAKRGAQVSLSIGIASVRPHKTISPTALIQWADEALYQAKAEGGNCCFNTKNSAPPADQRPPLAPPQRTGR